MFYAQSTGRDRETETERHIETDKDRKIETEAEEEDTERNPTCRELKMAKR